MSLDIILKLLYANNLKDIVTRAIQIEEKIPFKYAVDQEIMAEVHNNDIKVLGIKFEDRNSYGWLKCLILAIDSWDINKPYIIKLPSGDVKKYSEEDLDSAQNKKPSVTEAIKTEAQLNP